MKKFAEKATKKKLVKKPAAKVNSVKAYGDCSCGKLGSGWYGTLLGNIGI